MIPAKDEKSMCEKLIDTLPDSKRLNRVLAHDARSSGGVSPRRFEARRMSDDSGQD